MSATDQRLLYLDLADPEWRVVQIDRTGWRVLPESPVRFRRPRGMHALPAPEVGGSLNLLRRYTNPTAASDADDDWRLRLAWLIGACNPRGPYVVLYLNGGQGSVKSFAEKALRRVIDPNIALLRTAPREEGDLLITANNSWVVGFDNLSFLPDWLSDGLCRLATPQVRPRQACALHRRPGDAAGHRAAHPVQRHRRPGSAGRPGRAQHHSGAA